MTCPCGAAARKNGFCRNCHCRNMGMARANPKWKPEHELMLRRCYAVKTKKELTAALNDMIRRSGFTREYLHSKSTRLGLNFIGKRIWMPEELDYLKENSGKVTAKQMASELGRGKDSVLCQLQRMGLTGWVSRDDYSGEDIEKLLGVGYFTVSAWERRGLLRRREGRFSEREVRRFLRRNIHEYDLRKVDQPWFKGMVFGERSERASA